MFKAKAKYSPELNKYKVPLRLGFLLASLFFLAVNVTCAVMVKLGVGERIMKDAVLARVLINDSLFVVCAISLAVCIFKIAKMSSANVYLESKGTSVCQATVIGVAVILLYTSRACYNLVVVALAPEDRPSPFNYGWYNVSDQADVDKISGEAYIIFGVILFFWELLPTSLVVVFFRVQRPNQNLAPGGMISSHSFSSRAYFFDNPRRYDSDDDLTRSISSRGDRGSVLSTTPQVSSSWYGSIQRNGSLTGAPHLVSGPQAPTAPLLLAYGNIQTNQHHNYYSTPQN
ncbi:integral membrane protein GPR137C isoform X2 [Alosa sapidissima]|nr:integral membrane protein GPR137C isoform X2 [Alosa sapidissima]